MPAQTKLAYAYEPHDLEAFHTASWFELSQRLSAFGVVMHPDKLRRFALGKQDPGLYEWLKVSQALERLIESDRKEQGNGKKKRQQRPVHAGRP
jgi:hypothetical protein